MASQLKRRCRPPHFGVRWVRQPLLALVLVAATACGSPAFGDKAPRAVAASEASFEAGELPYTRGDDPALDRLHDACRDGTLTACDELWSGAPAGSAYERFGATCGRRIVNASGTFGSCADTRAVTNIPFERGDDDQLDALYVGCRQGRMQQCDVLWLASPVGSEYELFAATCGGRIDSGEERAGNCQTPDS